MKIKKLSNENRSKPYKLILINYANDLYKRSQRENTESAVKLNFFDEIISYGPNDIENFFFNENKEILIGKKGNGYWLWKPYFIKKTLERMDEGDFLFYCDSGSCFINSFIEVIDASISNKQDIIPFELTTVESEWTKRDAFLLMDCDMPRFYNSKQRLGGFSLWRKTDFSIKLVDEWLYYSIDKRIIKDQENVLGLPNYPNFKQHRHDQSIFSILTKKYNLAAYRDPSQYGNFLKDKYVNSKYPQFIELTRKRKIKKIDLVNKFFRRVKNKVLLILQVKNNICG